MKTKEFESLEKLLLNAKSPVYIFGGQMDIETKQDLENKIQEMESFIYSFNPKDANEQFRIKMVQELFFIHKAWALQSFESGMYYEGITYRLKIIISVIIKNKEKIFQILNEKAKLAKKIRALSFMGYFHSDTIVLLQNGIPIKSGVVREDSRSGTSTFAYFSESPEIKASDFKQGQVIEIETWQYSSMKDFIKQWNDWIDYD